MTSIIVTHILDQLNNIGKDEKKTTISTRPIYHLFFLDTHSPKADDVTTVDVLKSSTNVTMSATFDHKNMTFYVCLFETTDTWMSEDSIFRCLSVRVTIDSDDNKELVVEFCMISDASNIVRYQHHHTMAFANGDIICHDIKSDEQYFNEIVDKWCDFRILV
jgi:hypothetical protein